MGTRAQFKLSMENRTWFTRRCLVLRHSLQQLLCAEHFFLPAAFKLDCTTIHLCTDSGLDLKCSRSGTPVARRDRDPKWLLCAQVEASQAPYLCLDLTFLHTLLTEGFRIKEGSDVSLVKRVKYQAQEIEAAWPLGAAINLL